MKRLETISCLVLLATLPLWWSACATRSANPPHARVRTGYVDFHAEADAGLMWEVARFDDRAGGFQRVFSNVKPLEDRVLRLAFSPGRHRLRVTFLNRVIASPAEVALEVQDGNITPVLVTLATAGTVFVETKEVSRGATLYGRSGRRTTIGSDESVSYSISAVAEPLVAYQRKEAMPYAR